MPNPWPKHITLTPRQAEKWRAIYAPEEPPFEMRVAWTKPELHYKPSLLVHSSKKPR